MCKQKKAVSFAQERFPQDSEGLNSKAVYRIRIALVGIARLQNNGSVTNFFSVKMTEMVVFFRSLQLILVLDRNIAEKKRGGAEGRRRAESCCKIARLLIT